jgi:hypothetical protein
MEGFFFLMVLEMTPQGLTQATKVLCDWALPQALILKVKIIVMLLRDFRNTLPISNNKQWTAGNSVLPGLSVSLGYSLCWDPLFFSSLCYWTLSLSYSSNNPLQLSRARKPCQYHLPLRDFKVLSQQEVAKWNFIVPFSKKLYMYIKRQEY